MSLFRLLAALLVAPATAIAGEPVAKLHPTTELAVRSDVAEQVVVATSRSDFAALNAMERDYRTQRSRTPSGVWKLYLFHTHLAYYLQRTFPSGTCTFSAAPLIDKWEAVDPAAPAPAIARAALLLRQAWCFRGPGTVDKVVQSAWPQFHRSVEAAFQALKSHEAVASIDPGYYTVMAEIYQLQGRDKRAFRSLLDEATKREPYYYGTYFQAYQYYRPIWFGSVEDIDALARYAAGRTRERDGLGAYARLYWHVVQCDCLDDMAAIDWPMMKVAMADVIARWPDAWNAANFARIACLRGDGATAARYTAMLETDDGVAWRTKEERQKCQALVASNG